MTIGNGGKSLATTIAGTLRVIRIARWRMHVDDNIEMPRIEDDES
jgi:hypothetical protein